MITVTEEKLIAAAAIIGENAHLARPSARPGGKAKSSSSIVVGLRQRTGRRKRPLVHVVDILVGAFAHTDAADLT